jgi:hypothetical protein
MFRRDSAFIYFCSDQYQKRSATGSELFSTITGLVFYLSNFWTGQEIIVEFL